MSDENFHNHVDENNNNTNAGAECVVYLLQTVDLPRRTYIGATVDPVRRLEQHNGLRAGGARATRGRVWETITIVTGFATWSQCLSFEAAWRRAGQHRSCRWTRLWSGGSSKRRPCTPIERRLRALRRVLLPSAATLSRSTAQWRAVAAKLRFHVWEPVLYAQYHEVWTSSSSDPTRVREEDDDGSGPRIIGGAQLLKTVPVGP